jgi:hypothetical protein
VAQGEGPEFKPQYPKKKKKMHITMFLKTIIQNYICFTALVENAFNLDYLFN